MAHNVSVYGLSRAGFRVPSTATSGFTKLKSGTTAVIDLDKASTQLLLGQERDNFIRVQPSATFTVTLASPGVFTSNGHGLVNGDIVLLTTTGALPTGLVAGTKYYVIASTTNTFEVSTTYGGSAVNTSVSQSGTHTFQHSSANLVGLTRYGFRIRNSAGTRVVVRLKNPSPTQVDLSDYRTLRVLRRNYGRFFVSTSTTSVAVRGIVGQQRGFDLLAKESATITGSNSGNATAAKIVTVGAQTYTLKSALTEVKATDTVTTSGTPASVRATGTVTTSSTGAGNNDTLTVGCVTYTFKTALTGAANEVVRTGTIDVDLTNLASAINASAGSGTTYGTGTVANPLVSAGSVVSHVLTFTAKSYLAANGNAIALSRSAANLAVSGALLTGGTNESVTLNSQVFTFVEALDAATANEVLINGQDVSLTNLASAINGTSGSGTTYGTGTVASATVSAGAVTSHAITLTAVSPGTAGNAYTLAVSGSHLARGAATFSGGVNSIANEVLIGGSADATLTNVVEAVNATPNAGTDFSSATVANPDFTASGPTSHVITFTEKNPGLLVEPVSTNEPTYTAAGVSGGLAKVYQATTVTIDPSVIHNYKALRRLFRLWVES